MNKILNILLVGLTMIEVIGLFYLAIPKYRVQMIRLNDKYIMITKINTLTGETNTHRERTDGRIDIDYELRLKP
jgi:hypothetical protein